MLRRVSELWKAFMRVVKALATGMRYEIERGRNDPYRISIQSVS